MLLGLLGVGSVVVLVVWLGAQAQAPEAPPESAVLVTHDLKYHPSALVDVYHPDGSAGHPVIVLLHGCCGGREDLFQLAHGLASRGVVVFNAEWTAIPDGGRYPEVYEQAACAVRYARFSAALFGGDGSDVALLGFSDGALLGAVVTLTASEAQGECAYSDSSKPDLFIGVSGFYGWELDGPGSIETTPEMEGFFGGSPLEAPTAWAEGNPYDHLDSTSTSSFLLIAGEDDPLASNAACFQLALVDAGHDSGLTIVPRTGHLELISPRTPAGRIVVDETISELNGPGLPSDPEATNHCSNPPTGSDLED